MGRRAELLVAAAREEPLVEVELAVVLGPEGDDTAVVDRGVEGGIKRSTKLDALL